MTRKTMELIEQAQHQEHAARRIHAILTKLGDYAQQKGIKIDTGHASISFECPSLAKAQQLACMLGLQPCFAYIGARTWLEADVTAGRLSFHFAVVGRRKIAIDECYVHRTRRPAFRPRKATLFLHECPLADMTYDAKSYTPTQLKEFLYEIAKKKWSHKYLFA